MAVTSLISKTLKALPPLLRNSDAVGFNNRRRRMSITFIPPSTQSPLFLYGAGDQRSFLLLCLGSARDSVRDDATVSTSRSLPSTLSTVASDEPDQMTWLLEERRRYTESLREEDEEEDDHYGTSAKSIQSSTQSEDLSALVTNPKNEFRTLVNYSIPLIITFVLQQAFSVVCVLVVGHLGKNELAAVSLASMTSTITLAIFEGISTSLDTLCPQAYGAGNFHGVGVHFQRCTLFSLVFFVPCAAFWWFSEHFLRHAIHDEEVVRLTVQFLRVMIAGAPAYILFENGKRFLQAQGIFEAGTAILFITAPVNIVLSYLLVWHPVIGVGYVGAPIAAVTNFWFQVVLLYLYVAFVDGDKCWGGFSRDALHHWRDLAHLAIPGIVMLEAEYVAYEILTLFSSSFGTSALAAQSAISTIASLTYMVPFAVSIAAATRIANFVGATNVPCALIATRVGLYASLIVASANCVVLLSFKAPIARLFTLDSEVISLIVSLFPLVAAIQVFDGLASVASGILRAQGNQKVGGVVNLLGYYALAIPVSLLLGFYCKMELFGLWIGIGVGMIVIGVTESWYVLTADWTDIVARAQERNEEQD
ncbi:hypothetical protein BABINDRAFT_159718 [Babjeviella inositovora NRRL Y-12698]|uniref:MATE efflux family protein n=1 Tax=Babjeviella inositovora NRRL Y-12698 TaxID=984486 RepID=A0A1E3QWG9_9ASCO|nr:uncharacterized protein BABINDRAFT_159718 [Babjeviella inositovora NRRL Y-12698]ODQ81422.1 hypothetical protein BABINDRAFT_159718 [Babjeviella inositovora NRRL Y-12698]